ncbi:hypothetical protein [Nocardia ignorata]|uniref:Uncharacterized protein n=1 Tax=Nocardia ignorata TaxID=145285 RepID=A0A4R6P0L7_NOCIG|nr:hypothetical protein [Nocardia ignorata]TDP29812.1 hypothetical protein DFR75_11280 [Nocardia ignorata]
MSDLRTVAVVVWQDRHFGVDVQLFENSADAIEYARTQAKNSDRFGDLDETLTDAMKQGSDPWLYYGGYSCEGDHIYVIQRKVRE